MSTRAHIRVKNKYGHIKLYCHCDGYPSGLGRVLKKYLASLTIWEAYHITTDLIKGENIDDDFFFLHNIRPTTCFGGDENYVYVIDTDGKTIVCYRHYPKESFKKCCTLENEVTIPD